MVQSSIEFTTELVSNVDAKFHQIRANIGLDSER